jgi:hypothetical protein
MVTKTERWAYWRDVVKRHAVIGLTQAWGDCPFMTVRRPVRKTRRADGTGIPTSNMQVN